MTLTEFIKARLAEKERDADDFHDRYMCSTLASVPFPCDCGHPARVLREVAAMRKILAMHREAQGWSYPPGDGDEAVQEALTDAVSALAATWIDHPDYAEAVRP